MKLLDKTLVCLSLLSLGLSTLEAKSVECFFDHTTQETFNLQAPIPDQTQGTLPLYCKELKIENLGDQPIKNCLPYVNQAPCTSLDQLAARLSQEENALLALYHLWNGSIERNDAVCDQSCHPLDLLNFKGACSSTEFNLQFIKLCNALGIETRLANMHGKALYDFCLDDEWNFLDITHHQLYLGLNNERLVSSEEIMDDPFLALRTKHRRSAQKVDFNESWKQIAHFEIIEPTSATPIVMQTEDLKDRRNGLDLYPKETLRFGTPATHPELAEYERCIEHTLNLESRHVPLLWTYHSPFPIQNIVNESSTIIRLLDQKSELKPGESLSLKNCDIFKITFEFVSKPLGELILKGICAPTFFPCLNKGENHLCLGSEENPSLIRFQYEVDESLEGNSISPPEILNLDDAFDYCSPYFSLGCSTDQAELISWQISPDRSFQLVPSNFDQIETFTSTVTLPLISETFLNPGNRYYFRVKGYCKGKWSDWSTPYEFVVNKPAAVEEVEFEQVDEHWVELNWERCAEETNEAVEYLIFGSNSLDFIPSIYCEMQVNAIIDGQITEEEMNDNLIAITTEKKTKVPGGLAYYRIIARQRGQFSNPSTLIHIYHEDFVQPRNVLQVDEDEEGKVKRKLFPSFYPWEETSLPHISVEVPVTQEKCSLIKIQALLRSAAQIEKTHSQYELPDVPEEVWEEVRPYLLPSNHPAWPKLHRVFCKSRATLNPDAFKKAGFKRWRPGRWSRVSASSHPELKEYFIKAYCDCELGIIYDWKKWIHRIKGAETIRECIKKYQLQATFKVPHKWIYPLPKNPSPPKSSHYARKDFVLVCENMRIQDHDTNEKLYKKKMSRKLMDELYTVLQVCGLYDSVYCFNIPFCKDGRIAVIDTEYHHKWPVPFSKLKKNFSKDLRSYWEKITSSGRIPDGKNQPNPPRMDRRDVPKQKPAA